MQQRFKIAVLISGRGSNLDALLKNQGIYEVIAVISDNPEAPGLQIAKDAGVAMVRSFARANYANKLAQKQAIYDCIRTLNPDCICLSGFMQIIESAFVEEFFGKLINIHPSLLPKFSGLDTHKRAIAAGEKIHGCSVHFVDNGIDTGPVIAQATCSVEPNETEESLSAKVLEQEHKIYSWVVQKLATKEITFNRSQTRAEVKYTEAVKAEAARIGFAIICPEPI